MADEAARLNPAPAQASSARVRQRLVEVMARRASALDGSARERLEARLSTLRLAMESGSVEEQGAASLKSDASPVPPQPKPSPLAELLRHIQGQKELASGAPLGQPLDPVVGPTSSKNAATASRPPAEPQELQFFRRTWARLSVDRQLAQSRKALPRNAGPLNSHHIVHRTLSLMQQISPAYLEHFVGYVDNLLWLDQFNEQQFAQDPPPKARPSQAKKAAAAKPRG